MTTRRSALFRGALLQGVLVVAVLAVVGALAGVVWQWLWTPPSGLVVNHDWVPLNAIELQQEFSATGWYVVVGVVAGLLAGVVAALLLDAAPLLTLAGVLVGAALGAWLMSVVGIALGPADPEVLAKTAEEGVHLPMALAVTGKSPYLAYPVGALLGVIMVFIGISGHRRHPQPAPQPTPAPELSME
ncbi:hypothetical protein [Nocardioides mangrovi]|uniref:DUF2567 domain-containing protein n=1 Tax=Nocardioides mangrovi TaxID=2874580 RepID=A0ABS7U7H5_9ACTN|nr:hypothetical protein [Nocardioides mangrovi]MBZ5736829.1 hypothetical protein [Nocardioides mangrovi]